jgi:hypothetical protein
MANRNASCDPRVFIYGGLLLALLLAFAWGVGTRTPLIAEVLRDRNALYRETADGIENGYTLKLVNKSDRPAHYTVTMQSPTPGLSLRGAHEIDVAAGDVAAMPITVGGPEGIRAGTPSPSISSPRRQCAGTRRTAVSSDRCDMDGEPMQPQPPRGRRVRNQNAPHVPRGASRWCGWCSPFPRASSSPRRVAAAAARSPGTDDAVADAVQRTAQVQVADLGPDANARSLGLVAAVRVAGDTIEVLPVAGRSIAAHR